MFPLFFCFLLSWLCHYFVFFCLRCSPFGSSVLSASSFSLLSSLLFLLFAWFHLLPTFFFVRYHARRGSLVLSAETLRGGVKKYGYTLFLTPRPSLSRTSGPNVIFLPQHVVFQLFRPRCRRQTCPMERVVKQRVQSPLYAEPKCTLAVLSLEKLLKHPCRTWP